MKKILLVLLFVLMLSGCKSESTTDTSASMTEQLPTTDLTAGSTTELPTAGSTNTTNITTQLPTAESQTEGSTTQPQTAELPTAGSGSTIAQTIPKLGEPITKYYHDISKTDGKTSGVLVELTTQDDVVSYSVIEYVGNINLPQFKTYGVCPNKFPLVINLDSGKIELTINGNNIKYNADKDGYVYEYDLKEITKEEFIDLHQEED